MNLLLCPPSDEALRLLRRTQCQSGAVLAETHPLQGELADAMARAYATMGKYIRLMRRVVLVIQIMHVLYLPLKDTMTSTSA